MNQRTSYELLISEKAEQCSVPDLADNIWSAIETGLNASPANMNNDQGQLNTASHAGKSLNWWKLSLFTTTGVIAITTIVLLSLPKADKDVKRSSPVQPEHKAIPVAPAKDSVRQHPVEEKKPTQTFSPINKITPVTGPDSTLVSKDTVNDMPIVKPPVIDSVVTTPPQKLPDSSAAPPKAKKPRGVKGINLDDYKITPIKKDSTNGKQ